MCSCGYAGKQAVQSIKRSTFFLPFLTIFSKWHDHIVLIRIYNDHPLALFGEIDWSQWKEEPERVRGSCRRHRIAEVFTQEEMRRGCRYVTLEFNVTKKRLKFSFQTSNNFCT
jgi:hypothetical protein